MDRDWKYSVCDTPSSVNFGTSLDYVSSNVVSNSPIDIFYKQQKEIIRFCTPNFMENNPTIAPLMLVGLVSNVESYFRGVFAHCIKLCPIARKKVSNKAMNLSSIYFGYDFIELSAFENQSMSDTQVISKNSKAIFDIDVNNPSSSIKSPLLEFQKLCELRHSIVHSNGLINSKNAIELDLPSTKSHYQVQLSFAEIQNAALICTSLICASNIEFFDKMVNRWAFEWRLLPEYDHSERLESFKEIWGIFISEIDSANNSISKPRTLIKTKNKIEKELNL